jgi:hypothetical protein
LQCSAALIFKFDSPGPARRRLQAGVAADARLNARLFIRTDDVIVAAKGFPLPKTGIQIENDFGLLGEVWIAREDPILVPPRFEVRLVQNPPDGAEADRFFQGIPSPLRQIRHRLSAERLFGLTDGLASDGLNDGPIQRGKNRACARAPLYRPTRNHRRPSVVANAGPKPQASELRRRPPHATLRVHGEESKPARHAAAVETKQYAGAPGIAPRTRTRPGSPDNA